MQEEKEIPPPRSSPLQRSLSLGKFPMSPTLLQQRLQSFQQIPIQRQRQRSSFLGNLPTSPIFELPPSFIEQPIEQPKLLLFVGTEEEYKEFYNKSTPLTPRSPPLYVEVRKHIDNSIEYAYDVDVDEHKYKNMDIMVDPKGELIDKARKFLKSDGIYITGKTVNTRILEPVFHIITDESYKYSMNQLRRTQFGQIPHRSPERTLTKGTLFKITSVLGVGVIAGVIAGLVSSKK